MSHTPIPTGFPVKIVTTDPTNPNHVTCGHCGLTWDDSIPTSYTPAPAARCPFEYFHVYPETRTFRVLFHGNSHDHAVVTVEIEGGDDIETSALQAAAAAREVLEKSAVTVLIGLDRFDFDADELDEWWA